MLTLKSRCIQVLGWGVLCIRTLPNCWRIKARCYNLIVSFNNFYLRKGVSDRLCVYVRLWLIQYLSSYLQVMFTITFNCYNTHHPCTTPWTNHAPTHARPSLSVTIFPIRTLLTGRHQDYMILLLPFHLFCSICFLCPAIIIFNRECLIFSHICMMGTLLNSLIIKWQFWPLHFMKWFSLVPKVFENINHFNIEITDNVMR